jgi:predicted esterase
MSNKFSIEIIEAPKQNSIEWLQSIELERDLTLADWKQAREMYNDEIEAAAIIAAAERSTSQAGANSQAFAIGYSQGYTRALELIQWQIENQLKTENK